MSTSAGCKPVIPAPGVQGIGICKYCDTVYRHREPRRNQVIRCPRCDAVQARHHAVGIDGMLALVVAALILFLIANVWPIVTLGLGAKQNSATLWGMIIAMWQHGAQVMAVVVAATLFFFPLNKMLMLGWLLAFARRGRRAPGFGRMMVALHYLQPWTMSEVFVLGALVAIVKAGTYFDVMPDPGIYAYGALTLLITVFSGIDLRRLWADTTERSAR